MTTPIHTELAGGRWHTMSLVEQFGNIGSEISRALTAKESGNFQRSNTALHRGLELFDLTISDPKHRHRLKEICRAREVVCDYFAGDNEYQSTAEDLNRYFTAFGMAARLQ